MLIWLLVLLLLFTFLYVVYRMNFTPHNLEDEPEEEEHYTFKI
jgi:hypothetical protein